jgi:glutaminyl-peptide cyclotransferase
LRSVGLLLALLVWPFAAAAGAAAREAYPQDTYLFAPPVYGYEVVAVYPHDPAAFTQGLIYEDGFLYEGTGLHGRSSLRKVDLQTGEVLQQVMLHSQYFGEGITAFAGRIYQLTWRQGVAFVYEQETFAHLGAFMVPTEGWGLTHDGERLIMSDGSDTLYFRHPQTFAELGRVRVFDAYGPVALLNELEYIDGEVWANVWLTDRIARIDPDTGRVTAWVDLSGLLPEAQRRDADVLNGIAYDASTGRLFVTGKLWPSLFQIELIPPPAPHHTFLSLIR